MHTPHLKHEETAPPIMNNAKRLVGTVVLLALFGGALYFALRSNEATRQIAQEQAEIASAEPLKGLIAVDVEAFFKDDRVTQVLVQSKLPVHVARVGSRDMAAKIGTADQPDFFIASGVVAANMIADAARKAGKTATQTSPFHTPLVVASWEPVARILTANGMAKPMAPKVYGLDMDKLTQAMLGCLGVQLRQRLRDGRGHAHTGGGVHRVAQVLVDHFEIEPLRVEMPARPAEVRRVIVVFGIADHFQKVAIGPRSADIFGRARPGTVKAQRLFRSSLDLGPGFDPNFMLPVVAEIIDVDEDRLGLAQKIEKAHIGIVKNPRAVEAIIQQIRIAIAQPADVEFVQMRIGPTEGRLQNAVELGKKIF